jgi:RNA polymerase sigma-70 factor (ECF subfamily)
MSSLPVPTLETELGSLYHQHAGRILGYCLRRLRSREEAEDAVQQTFLNAFRGLRRGTTPRSEVAWLFKIAENVCRERHRAAWRRGRVETVEDPQGLAALAAVDDVDYSELDGLADALAALPPNQQRAILLREWQGLSYREIAAELDLTQSAVETLLFRARRSLAQKLDSTRIRSVGSFGSLAAWIKSLLGGAAAKVAATAVVVAAVTVATPGLRHQVQGAFASTPKAQQAAVRAAQPVVASHTSAAKKAARAKVHRAIRAKTNHQASGHTVRSSAHARGLSTVSQATPPPAAAPPPAPALTPPPAPALPPVPPVPPVNPPSLPGVPLPPLPPPPPLLP